MHQIQVEIVSLKIFEGSIDGRFDIVRVMAIVPELGRDEDLFSRDAAFLDASGYSGFSAVSIAEVSTLEEVSDTSDEHPGGVDMPIAGLERFGDGSFLGIGILPCSKSDRGCIPC